MFCTNCGSAADKTDTFCNICGNKIKKDNQRPKGQNHHNRPRKHRKPPPQGGESLQKAAIIAACIAVLALGISIGGFFILRNTEAPTRAHDGPLFATPPPTSPTPSPLPENEPYNANEDTYEGEEPYQPEPGVSSRFPFPGEISRHTSNTAADVVFLQNTLNHVRRYYTSIRLIESATGNFGGATMGAIVDFQVRAGLPVTGVVDEATWNAIMYVFENPPPSPDAPFSPTTGVGYTTLVNLHLRDAPSQDGESLGVKYEGTWVHVHAYLPQDSWFFVETEDGYIGYMKAEFLLMDGLVSNE